MRCLSPSCTAHNLPSPPMILSTDRLCTFDPSNQVTCGDNFGSSTPPPNRNNPGCFSLNTPFAFCILFVCIFFRHLWAILSALLMPSRLKPARLYFVPSVFHPSAPCLFDPPPSELSRPRSPLFLVFRTLPPPSRSSLTCSPFPLCFEPRLTLSENLGMDPNGFV